MNTPLPDDKIAALRELLFAGRKIEAIKLYREMTGLGLKEAKEAVEGLESSLRKEMPDRFKTPPAKGGCLGAAAVVGVCVATGLYWFVRA